MLFVVLTFIVLMTNACAVKKVDTLHDTKKVSQKASTSWDRILEKNKIVIGIDGNSLNKNLVDALKKEMNIDVETVVYKDFVKAGEAVKANEVDMYMGMFPKESSLSIEYAMSEPYLQSSFVVVSRDDEFVADKKNDTAAILKNTAEAMAVGSFFENSREFSSVGAMFQALNNSSVDCVLVDEIIFENSLYNTDRYHICDSYPYSLVALFNENDAETAKEMNIYLAKIKASGVAGEISRNYFGKDIIYK